jgi:hypothetical protein
MEKPIYDLKSSKDGLRYFFESKSTNIIQKAVIYFPIDENPEIYELSFGDVTDDHYVDFMNVSNNQDMEMVLATVIRTIHLFFEQYPHKMIYFRGSTTSRTRLYRAIISKHIEKLKLSLKVLGFTDGNQFEVFDKNHVYIGYLIQKLYEKEN